MRTLLLVAAAALLALLATRHAAVLAFRSVSPEFALRLNPRDPFALSRKYYGEMVRSGGKFRPADDEWIEAARSALRSEPLSSGALQILFGHGPQDRALVRTASAITRRDLTIELWQIEDAVTHDDIPGALLHYDRALSVHPEAGEMLFPILTGAVSDPEIRRALTPLLARDRKWVDGFLEYLSAKIEDYPAAIDLFRLYGGSHKVASHRVYETVLLDRLVGSGNGVLARMFGQWVAGFDIGGPTMFGLSSKAFDQTLLPLSWRTDIDDIVEADFDPQDGLAVGVPPSGQGVAASRVVILSPGRWTLNQTLEWEPAAPMAELSWSVTCLMRKSKQKIADIQMPPQLGRHVHADSFLVPASCTAIQFDLIARGPINDGEATAMVKSLMLQPGSV